MERRQALRYFDRFRSLHTYVLLWLFLPFAVLLTIILAAVISIYQNSMTQIVLERHQQLANLAAVTISQGIEDNAHVLEALGARIALQNPSSEVRERALSQSTDALVNFTAGVVQVDAQGRIITTTSNTDSVRWQTISPETLALLVDRDRPAFSNVVTIGKGEEVILIAVPTKNDGGQFTGAVIGGVILDDSTNFISAAIQKLTTSTPGIAYLVDTQGKIISHPDPGEIGKDFSDRPYIGQATFGSRGGNIWTSPEGEQFVGAETIVNPSGWSLVVKEPWDVITAPVRRYTLLIAWFALLALAGVFFQSWVGTRRVTAPILALSKSTALLASGEAIPPIKENRIQEIDHLHNSFLKMARQIEAYRDGLRHYVDAMTRSQEEERMRIARELHDETIQNLLAIYRRMELYNTTETDPARKQQLDLLHDMLHQTLQGVRRISQDLRPMMLDDLGFIPAVQMLVRAAHDGVNGVPDAQLKVDGNARPLLPSTELALYRIVQEAINNIRKHAQATRLQVTIQYLPSRIQLEIQDDGKGFKIPASFAELAQKGNLGLMGIQERVWAISGILRIESQEEKGTKVIITIPD